MLNLYGYENVRSDLVYDMTFTTLATAGHLIPYHVSTLSSDLPSLTSSSCAARLCITTLTFRTYCRIIDHIARLNWIHHGVASRNE